MRRLSILLALLSLSALALAGCGKGAAGQDVAAGQAAQAQGGADNVDDGGAQPTGRNPLITSLLRALRKAPDIEDSDRSAAEDILLDADVTLARIKQENWEALRQANRQLRVNRHDCPNIVLITANGVGYGDLGCYGQEKIKTPHLDRMARRGIRFTNYYAGTSLGPPSRWATLTGLHTGYAPSPVRLTEQDLTVAHVLWQAGYATGFVGQWELGEAGTDGSPNAQGFEYAFGAMTPETAMNYYPEHLWRNNKRLAVRRNQDGQKEAYAPDLYTQEALSYINRHEHEPFFLCVNYPTPRADLNDNTLPVPDDAPYSDEGWPQPMKNYAAMITRLDGQVGKILRELRHLDLDHMTVVFFTSDSGPHNESGADPAFFNSTGPFRGMKGQLYEGGIRVPMILQWRGNVEPGIVSDQVWAAWDLFPTAVDIANSIWWPDHLFGISMLPSFWGSFQEDHDWLYWQVDADGLSQAARMRHWKGVVPGPGPAMQLYNLRNDAGESDDLAGQEPDIAAELDEIIDRAPGEFLE